MPMTENDLAEIEAKLKITLPSDYREMMLASGDKLKASGCFNNDFPSFFLEPEEIIRTNKLERQKDAGTAYAFPNWWKTFFLVGTNGGGDYYCLPLDDQPGVWMIGSDCGDEPIIVDSTLTEFVDERLEEYEEENGRSTWRQAVIQEETSEELRASSMIADPRASEWATAESPYVMFRLIDSLGRLISPRKLRLFGVACCRQIMNIDSDDDCLFAIRLAEQMVDGVAAPEEVACERARLKQKYLAMVKEEDTSPARLWAVGACKNLLQDDQDYLNDAPIFAGDADLLRVWNSASSSGVPIEFPLQSDLLREVLGNLFHPVRFEPKWRTAEVVDLARKIHENRSFELMSILTESLVNAGCDNQRILTHCRREPGHTRGCWVLDLILENEPEPEEKEFTWDFTWNHPVIDAAKLKERLRSFGTNALADSQPDNERAALEFADWLEENGDRHWAKYIRVRCALDGKPPGEEYPDLFERYLECGASMRSTHPQFEGFYFSGYRFGSEEWQEDKTDDMELGLPSLVKAVNPGRGAGPSADLIQRLDALVRNTPVRGVNFQEYYPNDMGEILNSPGGQCLRSLAFENKPDEGETGPVINVIVKSPLAKRLERMRIDGGIKSDNDALSLANANFEKLCRLDLSALCGINCSADATGRLMTTPWFRNLGFLHAGFSDENCEAGMLHLAGMPNLHTLVLWLPPDRQMLAIAQTDEFQALRRLFIHCADLSGKFRESFSQLKAPRLIELWIRNSKVKASELRELLASPPFGNLRVLTFEGTKLSADFLDLLAESPLATQLRILRLSGDTNLVGPFHSLAGTSQTTTGAFPALTTLKLDHPYSEKAKRDTAAFLRNLATPQLRHLTLEDCDFDDECAEALSTNPVFANLTRLQIEQGYDATTMLTPQAAENLFRSPNLKKLIELKLHNFAIGSALESLADESVLPVLCDGNFYNSKASDETIARLKTHRPIIYVGS